VLNHNVPNAVFVAVGSVGSVGSASKHKAVDFVDYTVGSAAVDVLAVPGAELMDQYFEYFAGLVKNFLLYFGESSSGCWVEA
jgi:hypothetical protein